MKRHSGSGKFCPQDGEEESINPMEGVANLADVMLVFACGLMLALITYWNVDVSGAAGGVSVEQGEEITGVLDGLGETESGDPDARYEEYGTVYRDPDTGKLYLITEGESGT